jgi:hypothetical protein
MITVQEKLLLTERGQAWLSNFDLVDRETASRLVRALTLVSHSAFLRELKRQIVKTGETIDAPVALFAARELKPADLTNFHAKLGDTGRSSTVDAVGGGSDLGSEAVVANAIRSLCDAYPNKFLNHPNVGQMRATRCSGIFVVDDLVGSGGRIQNYSEALWGNRSIRSWRSRKNIQFYVISYAATEDGAKLVKNLKFAPSLTFARNCPTLKSLPWSAARISEVSSLCLKYGAQVAARSFTLGYRDSAALLVFEHACPNNVPAILWSDSKKNCKWDPLFPHKVVLDGSVFPEEIVRRDPVSLLMDIGQAKLASQLKGSLPMNLATILILAYAEKGVRTTGALSFATGLDEANCRIWIQLCVTWGFLTSRFRLTATGAAELKAAQQAARVRDIAPIGNDDYYPMMLRKAT